ncbi:MAG: PaaI family thioesterase, partial [Stenotrophobium sp.]
MLRPTLGPRMSTSNYHAALYARFAQSVPHVRELGIRATEVVSEHVETRLPYRDEWLGDTVRGYIHTGIITTLVDSTSGLSVLARLGQYRPIATLDLRMDYLRPALRGQELVCRSECFRLTENIAFARATVWQDDPALVVAISQGAFMLSSR